MLLRRKIVITINGLLATLGLSATSFAENTKNLPPAVNKFIEQMVEKNHFDAEYLNNLFGQIHMDPEVTAKMDKPYEAKSWTVYRNFFLTQDRIDHGAKYWREHSNDLAKAEKIYGVPANIIVAIIGVESNYGTEQMKFGVFQTLATFAFNYPKRAPFFTSELEHYLLLTREQHFDPLSLKGSYAGALGIPQFMPSSYRNYAVNLDGTKRADLLNNHADAISSIGNYLKRNGWQANQLVAVHAVANPSALKNIKQNPLTTPYTLSELNKKGVSWEEKLQPDAKATFFTVDFDNTIEPWVGLNNFVVISRYNHNVQYVLAVHELAEAIKLQRQITLREKSQTQKNVYANYVTSTAPKEFEAPANNIYNGEAELMADSPTE